MMTVACVLVQANVPFTPDYVHRLRSMVRRHLARPHRFVCLTDQAHKLDGIECIEIDTPRCAGWWSKIEMFNPEHAIAGRVLYLDLDVLLVAPLDPIVDYPADFAIIPTSGDFAGRDGLKVVKRYNSSVMVLNEGTRQQFYTNWTPAVTKRLWGDQDWLAEQSAKEAMFPLAWFPRISEVKPPWPPAAKVVLVKKPKPHDAIKQWPWFNEAWG